MMTINREGLPAIDVPELSDFRMTLGEMRGIIDVYIAHYSEHAIIEGDAGYNNISVTITTVP